MKVTRVPARPSGRSSRRSRPPWASTRRRLMNRPRPVPGMRDSRTFQARWNGSVTSGRSVSGMPTPSSSTVDRQPLARRPRPDRRPARPVGPYLKALPTRFSRIWPTRGPSTSSGGRSSGRSTTRRSARPVASRSPRSRLTSDDEQDRRALEDQRVGLQVGHVQDLADERRQPARDLVDALEVVALLRRVRSRCSSVSV